jgi:EpsI family protein
VALDLPESGQEASVNRLILQNGERKMASLYWYQCRGRILHNEYVERIYRVIDSIFMNRTDGAFIRLLAVNSDQKVQEDTVMLKDFATRIIPELREYLPE